MLMPKFTQPYLKAMLKRIEHNLFLVGTLIMVLAQSASDHVPRYADYPTITLDPVSPQRSISLHASFDKAVDNTKEVIAGQI